MTALILDVRLANQLIKSGQEQIAQWEEQVQAGINTFLQQRINQYRMEIEMLEQYIQECGQ